MAGGRRVDPGKITKFRLARKYDQTELASRLRGRGLGATQATVSRWENGQEPRAYALHALAAELGVKVDELYADGDDSEADLSTDLDAAVRSYLRRLIREEVRS